MLNTSGDDHYPNPFATESGDPSRVWTRRGVFVREGVRAQETHKTKVSEV